MDLPLDAKKMADLVLSNDSAKRGMADTIHNRLMTQIGQFEATLDSNHEVGAYLASFGGQHLIRIERIGYHNPYFIVFYGWTEPAGERVQLVQHTTQINVLLVALPILPDEATPRRIGFAT